MGQFGCTGSTTLIGRRIPIFGAVEFTVKYRFGLSDVMPYVIFQYYYGYMESLIECDRLQRSYRMGLAF